MNPLACLTLRWPADQERNRNVEVNSILLTYYRSLDSGSYACVKNGILQHEQSSLTGGFLFFSM